MKMKIDAELCTGHGRCAHYAPKVFRLDEDGYNLDRGSLVDVPAEEEANARLGMKSCPERAITLAED